MNKAITHRMRKDLPDEQARLEALFQHLEQLLPDTSQQSRFRRCSLEPLLPTVRLNPLRPQPTALRDFLQQRGEAVPWCGDAFVLPDSEQRLGRTLEHLLGAFYLQAKATTLAVEALGPRPGDRVLDLAAAPGGKSTQIAAALKNTGLLVANEPAEKRLPALAGNLERCGVFNAVLSQAPGALLARYFHNYFDRVLLDAPCSGDGLLRKDRRMLGYWSPEEACRKSQQQKGLLRAAFHMLRPGGVLVYSTCSLSLEENEEVLLALFRRHPGQAEVLSMDSIDGIEPAPLPAQVASRYPADFSRMARIWPHLHDTEGGFVAKLRKCHPTAWVPVAGDAAAWEAPSSSEDLAPALQALEAQWGFQLAVSAGQELVLDGRHLCLQPRAAAGFRNHYPYFVRAGLHLARRQQDHYYLTQQTVARWGDAMQKLRWSLSWAQVQALFRGARAPLDQGAPCKGEVLCCFGPWAVCWGLVEGECLQGMVPKAVRCANLERIL